MIEALLLAAAVQTPENEMLLICQGETMANINAASTRAQVVTSDGRSAYGTAQTTTPATVPFSVQFRMISGKAEMNVPSMATGGASGEANWFPVSNLRISESEISGKVKFGFLYGSSKFRIDRRTGRISTSGGFQGICERQNLAGNKF